MTPDQTTTEAQKSQAAQDVHEQAQNTMSELENDPPEKLEDWPTDAAKYKTFGGPEGDHSYEEGPERNLGPSEVRHHEDGSVSVAGEKVDDPDEYKGEPIPGGPTDPNAPRLSGEQRADAPGDSSQEPEPA